MKVLLVDDAGVMRKVITRELVDMGFSAANISEAVNGAEGVQKASAFAYDLILMDWNMPEMLGIDALATLRAAGNKTPIIMVTTEAERANIVRAIQTGANNYLTKPFNKQDFQAKIKQTIGEGPFTRVAEPEPVVEEEKTAKTAAFNSSSGRLQLG